MLPPCPCRRRPLAPGGSPTAPLAAAQRAASGGGRGSIPAAAEPPSIARRRSEGSTAPLSRAAPGGRPSPDRGAERARPAALTAARPPAARRTGTARHDATRRQQPRDRDRHRDGDATAPRPSGAPHWLRGAPCPAPARGKAPEAGLKGHGPCPARGGGGWERWLGAGRGRAEQSREGRVPPRAPRQAGGPGPGRACPSARADTLYVFYIPVVISTRIYIQVFISPVYFTVHFSLSLAICAHTRTRTRTYSPTHRCNSPICDLQQRFL